MELKKGFGYTTGSCATAAAKACAHALLFGKFQKEVHIITPNNTELFLEVLHSTIQEDYTSCAIRKFSGDDPDVTNGIMIYAKAEKICERHVEIHGGQGVGKVTLKGLDIAVGEAAINKTPRRTIKEAVADVLEHSDYEGGIKITISVPSGEEIAKKTYNSRLGIMGGISIIGTSGIVEPMSAKALIDTIYVEMKMLKAQGVKDIIITPGNYGRDFIEESLNLPDNRAVKCSNYLGEALDFAREFQFESVLIIGHVGKFIKVCGGVYNTHSNNCDIRTELIATAAVRCGAENELLNRILDCVVTEDALDVLKQTNIYHDVLKLLGERLEYYIKKRYDENFGAIMFSQRHGLLVKTEKTDKILKRWKI